VLHPASFKDEGRETASARFHGLLAATIVGAIVLLCAASAAFAAAPTYDLTGAWTTGYESEGGTREAANGSYDITAMNMSTGAFSGTAEVLGTSFQVEGTESGSLAQYTLTEGGYTAYDTLHLSIQENGKPGGDGTFNESGYSETGSKYWAELTGASGKRASATSVTCNLEIEAGDYDCLATVGDASGEAPSETPTGEVAFTASSGGFIGSSRCALQQTPSSAGVAECSVLYEAPPGGIAAGTAVPVSASYPGDVNFNPSEAADRLLSKPPETGAEAEAKKAEETKKVEEAKKAEATSGSEHQVSLISPQMLCKGPISFGEPALYSAAGTALAAEFGRVLPDGLATKLNVSAPVVARSAKARSLSSRAIRARAMRILHPRARRSNTGTVIYRLPAALAPGAVIGEGLPGSSAMQTLRLRTRAWLYWADLAPGSRFEHPSILLVLDARSGRVVAQRRLAGVPFVAGRPAAFVGSRHPERYLVYSRLARHHLTSLELRRTRAAQAFAQRQAAASRMQAHRAGTNAKAALITLVSPKSTPTEPFATEGQAISGVFTANGVRSYEASSVDGLRSTLNEATAAGARNITLFLDAHGTSPIRTTYFREAAGGTKSGVSTDELSEISRTGALPPGVMEEHSVGETHLQFGGSRLSPAELKEFVAAHPEVTFNIIVTSCYSGNFIPTLSTVPNVSSVSTSSSGNEFTSGNYEVVKNGVQTTLTPPAGVRADIAPYVAAEVYSLQKAFEKAGSGDVSTVVKSAQQIEPEYDAAALAGAEHPSVPWTDTEDQGGGATRSCSLPVESDGEVDAIIAPASAAGEAAA
jgi:hypothetical protein